VGRIEDLWPDEFDGWWKARFRLNASLNMAYVAADRIDVGMPVSPCFGPVAWRDEDGGTLYDLCWLHELSLLMPPRAHPAYKGARVTRVKDVSSEYTSKRTSSSPAAVLPSSRAVAGDPYEDDYRPAIFDELEWKLGRRVDWDNYEAALHAHRRPLDALYDEHMAAKRAAQSQVLIRPGFGQVLGVR
jgi:hypothetical protein